MQPENEMATVRKGDLDMLVAACTSYLPADVSPQVLEAFERMLEVFDEAHDIAGEVAEPEPPAGDGYFAEIAFMGHIEHVGYVTEILKNGQPAYHIDLPDKLWGGNPLAWVEHAASAWFSERPLSEESVRKAWMAERERAAARARQQAEWQRMQGQQAIGAGDDDDDPDDGYDRDFAGPVL